MPTFSSIVKQKENGFCQSTHKCVFGALSNTSKILYMFFVGSCGWVGRPVFQSSEGPWFDPKPLQSKIQSVLEQVTELQIALNAGILVYECEWVVNALDEQVAHLVTATTIWMCVNGRTQNLQCKSTLNKKKLFSGTNSTTGKSKNMYWERVADKENPQNYH